MKNKILSIALLFSILIFCNTCNDYNSKNDWIVDMELEGTVNVIDTIVKKIRELDLPLLQIKTLNDTMVNLTFMSNFDSTILSKIFKVNRVELQETFDFYRLANDIDTIIFDLANFGSEITWKKVPYEIRTSDDNEKSHYIGPHIGNFLVKDTSEINACLNSNKIRKRLPSDLVFEWGKFVNQDSLSLYMIKANSINEMNMINISTAHRKRICDTEHDENGNPIDCGSKYYYEILFTFNSNASKILYEFTRRNVGHYIVIKLNGTVIIDAQVSMPIEGEQMSYSSPTKDKIIRFYKLILFPEIDGLIKINKFELK